MAASATAQQSESTQQPVRIRVSAGLAEGLLKHKVEPQYPQEAIAKHIEGHVLLVIVIDKEGNVTNLRAISGNPILAASALEAVKQWKYRPYQLNKEPVVVETQVTIKFRL